jgi:hypothetical protein
MVIFHRYVSIPEGSLKIIGFHLFPPMIAEKLTGVIKHRHPSILNTLEILAFGI